jgi:LPXTG-site transpeptidase (sortase) family protein
VALPDDQKHQVWQEFYDNNARRNQPELYQPAQKQAKSLITSHQSHHQQAVIGDHTPPEKPADPRPASAIRQTIRRKVATHSDKIPAGVKQNARSMLFGLATASIVLVIFLFSFFNQVIIAPFIQPSRASATPIIVNSESVDASETKVIIPKINLEIPVVYDLADNSEATIQKGLESGVIHYPTTPRPGEKGNAAYFGHSSNNIFNKGKYKFAFVLLHKLEVGDTYYLTYNNTVYSYKVIDKKIVSPSQTEVLNNVPDQVATSTLITCDPPGTSLNRLVIVGQQISPDPAGNSEATPGNTAPTPVELTGNGPSLWSRMWDAIF